MSESGHTMCLKGYHERVVSGSGGRHSRYGKADASADHVVEGVSVAVVDGLVVEAVYGHFGGNGQLGHIVNEEAREGDLPRHCDVGVNRDSGSRPDRISAGKRERVWKGGVVKD